MSVAKALFTRCSLQHTLKRADTANVWVIDVPNSSYQWVRVHGEFCLIDATNAERGRLLLPRGCYNIPEDVSTVLSAFAVFQDVPMERHVAAFVATQIRDIRTGLRRVTGTRLHRDDDPDVRTALRVNVMHLQRERFPHWTMTEHGFTEESISDAEGALVAGHPRFSRVAAEPRFCLWDHVVDIAEGLRR